jgi:microcystin-dependent protein
MSTPFLAEIRLFAGNFAPRGWALCAGQILSIAQNTALFSLLGTTYGGNGQTTFALPDFRGRTPVGTGQGLGLSSIPLGELAGTEAVTLLSTEYPSHTHQVNATQDNSTAATPGSNFFASQLSLNGQTYGPASNLIGMDPQMITPYQGGNQPHNNMQPFLGINFIIALEGIFPARN